MADPASSSRRAHEGRTLLTEIEAKQMLEAGGRAGVAGAAREDDATRRSKIADELGFPIVLKIVSPQITHKSDVGGVALGLASADEVGRGVRPHRRVGEAARAGRDDRRRRGAADGEARASR